MLIVTSGSVGDAAPYTGLGARLQAAGHEVTVASHAPFEAAFAAAGLPFRPIPGDLREILPQARGQDGRSSGTGPRALAGLLRIARPLIAELGDGIAAAAERAEPEVMLLSTVVAPLGYQVAEARGIPWAGVFLQPVAPTGDFGSVLLGGRSIGRLGNRAVTAAAARVSQTLYAGPVQALRRRLGLPHLSIGDLRTWQDGGRYPAFHGFSPAVVPRPSDWRPQLEVTGYWWPAPRPDWTPPAALEDFLAAGPPPVLIGFGSMGPGQASRLAEIISSAVRTAGVRAVVQAGWAGLDVASDDILTIGEAPHDRLLPRMAAMVHHAGAGTTAAGLRAGVPAVPVPVLADQPFWAARLRALGAATAPIPMSRLTAGNLAAALREVTTDPHRPARAQ
ncbi:glycosyltransferase, partial [Actinoplanes sp. NPDC051633]|uniref:glycosyltransferase n=1 Tax=Actinoplanes sp. NPDC051633 TaxID=3155670 RepID=UPI0034163827